MRLDHITTPDPDGGDISDAYGSPEIELDYNDEDEFC